MTLRRRLLQRRSADAPGASPLMAMVDVVFLLMIFFLFGSTRFHERQLVASLTRSASSVSRAPGRATWLTLRSGPSDRIGYRVNDGAWIDDAVAACAVLSTTLTHPGADGALIVDALPGVRFQALMDALALGQRCGAATTTLRAKEARP